MHIPVHEAPASGRPNQQDRQDWDADRLRTLMGNSHVAPISSLNVCEEQRDVQVLNSELQSGGLLPGIDLLPEEVAVPETSNYLLNVAVLFVRPDLDLMSGDQRKQKMTALFKALPGSSMGSTCSRQPQLHIFKLGKIPHADAQRTDRQSSHPRRTNAGRSHSSNPELQQCRRRALIHYAKRVLQ